MHKGLSEQFWVNLAGFQLAWWSLVLFQHQALAWVAPLLVAHLLLHRRPRQELLLMLAGGLTGYAVDSLLTLSGLFQFAGNPALAPLWLLLLWLAFCATLNQSLRYFAHRYRLSALCGALGASTTYVAAAELGAVSLGLGRIWTLLILALIWALLFPFLVWLRDRLEVTDVCYHAP